LIGFPAGNIAIPIYARNRATAISRAAARWSLQYNRVRNEPTANREQPRRGQASIQRRAQQVEHGKRKQAEVQNDGAEHKSQTPNAPQTTGQRV
jgi:hypothetical protein